MDVITVHIEVLSTTYKTRVADKTWQQFKTEIAAIANLASGIDFFFQNVVMVVHDTFRLRDVYDYMTKKMADPMLVMRADGAAKFEGRSRLVLLFYGPKNGVLFDQVPGGISPTKYTAKLGACARFAKPMEEEYERRLREIDVVPFECPSLVVSEGTGIKCTLKKEGSDPLVLRYFGELELADFRDAITEYVKPAARAGEAALRADVSQAMVPLRRSEVPRAEEAALRADLSHAMLPLRRFDVPRAEGAAASRSDGPRAMVQLRRSDVPRAEGAAASRADVSHAMEAAPASSYLYPSFKRIPPGKVSLGRSGVEIRVENPVIKEHVSNYVYVTPGHYRGIVLEYVSDDFSRYRFSLHKCFVISIAPEQIDTDLAYLSTSEILIHYQASATTWSENNKIVSWMHRPCECINQFVDGKPCMYKCGGDECTAYCCSGCSLIGKEWDWRGCGCCGTKSTWGYCDECHTKKASDEGECRNPKCVAARRK